MPVDLAAVRSRYRLGDVARRFGVTVDADMGDVFVRCPLPQHPADNTPSMLMHLDSDRFCCFGCGAQGDVVQWVQEILGVSFLDAVRALESETIRPIARSAISPPAVKSGGTKVGADQPDLKRTPPSRIRATTAAAWDFYSSDTPHGQALGYLAGRGINVARLEAQTSNKAAGFTPPKATGLRNHLLSQGFTDDELVDASLINRYPDGRSSTDFFRQRVMLPIRDDHERVTGFVGRDVSNPRPDFKPAKYLNSRTTVTYDKSTAIYRPSRQPLSKHASIAIVEGTLDALMIASVAAEASLSQHYAPVSTSGLEWSATQRAALRLIHPYPPVLAFDGDNSGLSANIARGRDFLADGTETVVTIWPNGQDPADYLLEHGPCGLAAVTRKGCLSGTLDTLRPVHIGHLLASEAVRGGSARTALSELTLQSLKLSRSAAKRMLEAAAGVVPVVDGSLCHGSITSGRSFVPDAVAREAGGFGCDR